MNLIKKAIIEVRYGMTRTGFWLSAVLLGTAVLYYTGGLKVLPIMAEVLVAALAAYVCLIIRKDKSRNYAEVWKSIIRKDHVICQKREAQIKEGNVNHQCPSSLFCSELNEIIGTIKKGDTFRTVTHGRVITQMKKTPAFKAGKVEITTSEMEYKDSVRKYEKALYDDMICQKCTNPNCRIKKAKENDDFSDKEAYYGVIIRRV